MTNQRGHFDVQMFQKFGQVVCILIHVVAVPGLTRAPVSPTIMGDYSIPALPEIQHLRIPGVCAERPSVRKRYDRPRSPVLVEDRGAILGEKRVHLFSLRVNTRHEIESRTMPIWLAWHRTQRRRRSPYHVR